MTIDMVDTTVATTVEMPASTSTSKGRDEPEPAPKSGSMLVVPPHIMNTAQDDGLLLGHIVMYVQLRYE